MTDSIARLGLVVRDLPGHVVAKLAKRAEAAGFTDLFLPEMGYVAAEHVTGRDPFLASASALSATTRLRVGPGVAITPVRSARATALLAAGCQEDSGGRFVLGCGVSHRGALAAIGLPFPDSPLTHTADYVAHLRDLSRRTLAFGRDFPVLLGALGPRMLRLSATTADGAMLNWLTPEHAKTATETIAEAAAGAPRESALYLRVGTPSAVRQEAELYLTRFPNYRKHFARQGITSVDEAARRTAIPSLATSTIREVAESYRAAGVTLPCLSPTGLSTREIGELVDSFASS
ncbi:LLM class flavin-dependent oxidoreductase [Amycolatopsis sp. NPDC051903]|uniref:LLM class flavin-dependent oxidoreductase n=1 Tax=Amycolatopsis sp. NPDC051903 TaxID=3363936 RepID=UPI0037B8D8D3